MTDSVLKDRISDLKQQVWQLYVGHVDPHSMDNACLKTIWQVYKHLQDAEMQADHPTVNPTDCIMVRSGVHKAAGWLPACGTAIDWGERVTPLRCVPNCPDCLAILEKTPHE